MLGNKTLRHLTLALAALLPLAASAQTLKPEQLPRLLQDWLPWAWHGHETERCPKAHDGQAEQPCVWHSHLDLKADGSGAQFRYEVRVLAQAARVLLPGEPAQWPQDVKEGGQALAVTEQDGRPGLLLAPGLHVIEGKLPWRSLPQDLLLPPALGSLQATLNGQLLRQRPDAEGRLPLRAGDKAEGSAEALSIQVLRRLDDDLPQRLTTRITFELSGTPRELALPLALLPGWQAHEIRSPLPVRLQDDGRLVLLARPGRWTLELEARSNKPFDRIELPKGGATEDEVWSFAAHNELRVVTPSGGQTLDPRQVEMPEDWRQLPAFRLQPGAALTLAQSRRGTEQPEADALRLDRKLWLDFNGQGFTAQDHIAGRASRATRLDLLSPAVLGRASVNGSDQTLTQGGQQRIGFALRDTQVEVDADSRVEGPLRRLAVAGWSQDFESVHTSLLLPPGWWLLHAGGAETVVGSWISAWTLWDLFFWLLAALGAGRLLGWRAGALCGLALGLAWQLEGSPGQWMWLSLLALLAMRHALPEGHRGQRWIVGMHRIAALLLALCLLPFAVDQVRWALHPQLAPSDAGRATSHGIVPSGMARKDLQLMRAPIEARVIEEEKPAASPYALDSMVKRLREVDPRARVQTGPGLPTWEWKQHALDWNGPVSAAETLSLWLLPPWAVAAWRVAATLLLALVLGLLARGTWSPIDVRLKRWLPRTAGGARPAMLLLLLVLSLGAAHAAEAEIPGDALLQQLRERTQAPPACLPRCAELARGLLTAQGSRVQLRLDVHAQAEVALPLPGQGRNWSPERITLDGKPASTRRDEQGQLWLLAPAGVSQVLLESDVGSLVEVGINLPLPLRELLTQLQGWSLAGLDARGLPGGALSLNRAALGAGSAKTETGTPRDALPPLVRVERHLSLGLQWQVETVVTRLSPSRAPVSVRVALLEGESVTEAGVSVQDGEMRLQMGGDGDTLRIHSALKVQPVLHLKASTSAAQIEQWQLAAAPRWQVRLSGIAPIAHSQGHQWAPLWRPWPGEQVELQVQRPQGVEGQTLTLDSVHLAVSPGATRAQVAAKLVLRASLGGEHRLQLPSGAELLSLTLDGAALPLQAREGRLSLPLTPGRHELNLNWRSPVGMSALFRSEVLGLGLAGVNETLSVELPRDRIALAMGLSGAPSMGPAVLFWAVLIVVFVGAALLRRVDDLPLRGPGWVLLALGVAPAGLGGLAVLLGWFALLRQRARWAERGLSRGLHNLVQVLLVVLTLLTVFTLLNTLRVGLLGYPDLLIEGHESYGQSLNWYVDRLAEATHSVWVLSLPMWVYRLAMLAWALWLASAMLGWLRWAWERFSVGGLWKSKPVVQAPADAP